MQELITRYPAILLVMLGLSLAEWLWARFVAHRSYDVAASAASIGVAVGQVVLKPLSAGMILGFYTMLAAYAPWQFPLSSAWTWIAGFFALEFAYYWFHRWSHRINWLWATHAVHHSANELTLPAAIRLGWTGPLSGGWLVFAPLVLLGFPPVMIGLLLALNLLYQFSLHTEAMRRWGLLEWVLNTPSHHRAHHSSDGPWLDCNFGGVLIIFDRWFGTFVPEPEQGGLRYGLTEPLQSYNPVTIALRQWVIMARAFAVAPDWYCRGRIVWGRPAELNSTFFRLRKKDHDGIVRPTQAELSIPSGG
jgi:sterol desaturase/sphingolipid hydroxylase (fatty acid hydroxylase superfamily)